MDGSRFDRLTREVASGLSRRRVIGGLVGGFLAFGRRAADARPKCRDDGQTCEGNHICCDGLACVVAVPGKAGRCATCPPGQIACGNRCIPKCSASDECHVAGVCEPAKGKCTNPIKEDGSPCSLGTCCNGRCVDTFSDPHNCGTCGGTCPSGTCIKGFCGCSTPGGTCETHDDCCGPHFAENVGATCIDGVCRCCQGAEASCLGSSTSDICCDYPLRVGLCCVSEEACGETGPDRCMPVCYPGTGPDDICELDEIPCPPSHPYRQGCASPTPGGCPA